jgi:hypothetical protein
MTSWMYDFSIPSPQEEIQLTNLIIPSISLSPNKEWLEVKIPTPIEEDEKLFDIMPPKPLEK